MDPRLRCWAYPISHPNGHTMITSITSIRWVAAAALLAATLAGAAAADTSWALETRLWRNIIHEAGEYDAEMAAIDAMVDPDKLPDHALHVRALISRFDAVDHYRAKDNMALIVEAIGTGTYPGYPAVDVLMRRCEIHEERRQWFLGWSRALAAWARDQPASSTLELSGEEVRVQDVLGERTQVKEWLAASLATTLAHYTLTPADRVAELDPELFVRAVYQAALGRDPSADDLRFRLKELAEGKQRDAFVEEIYGSSEALQHRLHDVLCRAGQLEPE